MYVVQDVHVHVLCNVTRDRIRTYSYFSTRVVLYEYVYMYTYSYHTKVRKYLFISIDKPPKKHTRDQLHIQKCTRQHPRAKPISSARDARLRAKLCTMPVLKHAHNRTSGLFFLSFARVAKKSYILPEVAIRDEHIHFFYPEERERTTEFFKNVTWVCPVCLNQDMLSKDEMEVARAIVADFSIS